MDGTQIIGFRSDYPGTMFPGFYFEKILGYFPGEKRQIQNNLSAFVGDNRNMSEQFGSGE